MKPRVFHLTSLDAISKAIEEIKLCPCDGKLKVTISDAGTKSARQRGLQWIWYGDIAKSGKGGRHCDTPEGVHLVCKYRFALPIFIRDNGYFSDLWSIWYAAYKRDEKRILFFIDREVSTEEFSTSQMAEYLTEIQKDCYSKEIVLTDPDFRGLLDK